MTIIKNIIEILIINGLCIKLSGPVEYEACEADESQDGSNFKHYCKNKVAFIK